MHLRGEPDRPGVGLGQGWPQINAFDELRNLECHFDPALGNLNTVLLSHTNRYSQSKLPLPREGHVFVPKSVKHVYAKTLLQ